MSLMEMSRPIVAVLQQGEQVAGRIVWYDQECIKIKPADDSPDLIIPKTSLKYLLEASVPSLNPPIESEHQETTPGPDRATPD